MPRGSRSSPAVGRSGARDRRGGTPAEPDDPGSAGADPRERARAICLRLLAARPRTRAELAAALRRRGIPEPVAEEILDRYGEVGMIDDVAFAEAWVTSRHHGRGLARRALGQELRQRGVAGDTVREALRNLDPVTEERTARELVQRRLRTMGGAPPEVLFRRLAGMLARKGYPPGLALRVVRDALAERPDTAAVAATVDLDALSDMAEAEQATAVEDGHPPD